ncbi:MAG: hypothetical protein K9H61_06430 [Bacteroidia bacterium]|nr:hypothetical protein [Bacteroidia bacterium]MCF8427866.1 hypothetical protein [Bacteroidia bacterium]MCF8446615.1 hypothetical protein [Bacteroidia bacterium]
MKNHLHMYWVQTKFRVVMLLFFALTSSVSIAQVTTQISIFPRWHDQSLQANTWLPLVQTDSIQITQLRFYVSNLSLFYKGRKVWSEPNSFHLLDLLEPSSFNLSLQLPQNIEYDALQFNVGIDSATSVSGAMGGDLDPTKGMYWTWQSGYINFKLEALTARQNQELVYHIGGYQAPYNTLQEIQVRFEPNSDAKIYLQLDKFFEDMDCSKINHVMSPNASAMQLARLLPNLFLIGK